MSHPATENIAKELLSNDRPRDTLYIGFARGTNLHSVKNSYIVILCFHKSIHKLKDYTGITYIYIK